MIGSKRRELNEDEKRVVSDNEYDRITREETPIGFNSYIQHEIQRKMSLIQTAYERDLNSEFSSDSIPLLVQWESASRDQNTRSE